MIHHLSMTRPSFSTCDPLASRNLDKENEQTEKVTSAFFDECFLNLFVENKICENEIVKEEVHR